jgi:thymidylate synthase (FAD)
MRTAILDHGYLEVVEHWGSDERIVEAARMSTQKGFMGWGVVEKCDNCNGSAREPGYGPNHNCRTCGGDFGGKGYRINKPGDEKLLRYLMENHHETPFEMAGMVIEVQAPIMVFREWHRHRTQSYNEMSARYAPLLAVDYLPTVDRCLTVNGANKQANAVAGAAELTHESALAWLEKLAAHYAQGEAIYQEGLSAGVPKELARLTLTVGRYSRMRASANLRNWLAFLTLRSDVTMSGKAAQWEIRQYANAVAAAVAERFPRTYELFVRRESK